MTLNTDRRTNRPVKWVIELHAHKTNGSTGQWTDNRDVESLTLNCNLNAHWLHTDPEIKQ